MGKCYALGHKIEELCLGCLAGFVRDVVGDELEQREDLRRAACGHARSGTLSEGEMTCDDCGKVLGEDDEDGPPADVRGGMSLGRKL